MDYYVISVHHTRKDDRYILLWRPDNRGYTFRLSTAGKYDHDTIMAHQGYYNTGCSNIVVPCDVADAMSTMTTPADMLDGPDGPALLNTKTNWHALMAAVIRPTPHRIKPKCIYFGRNAA